MLMSTLLISVILVFFCLVLMVYLIMKDISETKDRIAKAKLELLEEVNKVSANPESIELSDFKEITEEELLGILNKNKDDLN